MKITEKLRVVLFTDTQIDKQTKGRTEARTSASRRRW